MRTRADTTNRVILTFVGVVLLAAGACGLAASYGALGTRVAHDHVLLDGVRHWTNRNLHLTAALGALGCATLSIAALAWLARQLRYRLPHDDLTIVDAPTGRTMVTAAGLIDAIEQDLQTSSVVQSARVGIAHAATETQITARLRVHDDTPVRGVSQDVVRPAVDRYRTATGEAANITTYVLIDYVPARRTVE